MLDKDELVARIYELLAGIEAFLCDCGFDLSALLRAEELARELVDKIQERLEQMDHWTEKPETRAEVDTLIRNELYQFLPRSYPDDSLNDYRAQIYQYFYSRAA